MIKNEQVLVTTDMFHKCIDEICKHESVSLDTETTGLYPYHGDYPFSVAISTNEKNYYFNFNKAVDIPAPLILDRGLISQFQKIIDKANYIFIQNAKFDMHHLNMLDWSRASVYCTEVMGRLINNERRGYSLAEQAKLIGHQKDDTVEKHIKTAKLYEERTKGPKTWKNPCYNKVPFQMIANYAMIDAEVCFDLGIHHLKQLRKLPKGTTKNPMTVLANEVKITRVLYEMEKTGVKCDLEYVKESLQTATEQHEKMLGEFKGTAGIEYMDSPMVFSRVFHDTDHTRFVKTVKGNLEFSRPVLKTFTHPAAPMVISIRKLASDINFFKSFLFAADDNGIIHTDYRQPGTRTARFSSRNPNLQNLKRVSDDDGDIVVRRAIVPREGYRFFMVDYDQMEYRMMLDYAGAQRLIDLVNSGLDVHTATAEIAGVDRKTAKNVNFGTLYGQGMESLAAGIGCSVEEAERIQKSIFDAAPEVKTLIDNIQTAALHRRVLYNWAGRPYMFPFRWMKYKSPNTVIQGGSAEALRFAMTLISEFLRKNGYKTRIVLNIHDELILEVWIGEEHVIPPILDIMENVYPYKWLKLTCGVDFSDKSLADKQKWEV